jgi:chromate transporter
LPNSAKPAIGERGRSRELRHLAALFLRLGTTAFGGPAAHLAIMREEVVSRRHWLSDQEFLDLISACNLIPGPNSTEMAIHIGHRRGGWPGLLIAGSCFILPAAVMVTAIAWAYTKYGSLPVMQGVLVGVKPVVVVIVLQALVLLRRSALKSRLLQTLAFLAALLSLVGVYELTVLFGLAAAAVVVQQGRNWPRHIRALSPIPLVGLASDLPSASPALVKLFLVMAKVGSVLFGSGYVLLAFLKSELVEQRHWITAGQLLDAVAVGQITPGPLFTTATFLGYVMAGPKGAAVATVGIFFPAFVFVALTAPFLERLRRSSVLGVFLDGLNAASLGLIAAVTVQIGRTAFINIPTMLIAAVAALLLFRFRVSSTWLVLGGAVAGWLISVF